MGDTTAQQNANLGTWGNMYRSVTTTYTVALLDKGWTVSAAGAASYTISLTAASGYDQNFQVVIVNADPSNNKTVAPNGLSSFTLLPGQSCLVYNNNSAWKVGLWQTSSVGSAWTTYSPTITAFTGTITSSTVNSARFLQMGKVVFLELDVTITNNGTGSVAVQATLPVTSAAFGYTGNGSERGVSGKMLSAGINIGPASSTTIMQIIFFDATYPGATNNRLCVSIFYEAA